MTVFVVVSKLNVLSDPNAPPLLNCTSVVDPPGTVAASEEEISTAPRDPVAIVMFGPATRNAAPDVSRVCDPDNDPINGMLAHPNSNYEAG